MMVSAPKSLIHPMALMMYIKRIEQEQKEHEFRVASTKLGYNTEIGFPIRQCIILSSAECGMVSAL